MNDTTTNTKTTYICRGSVRGDGGTQHRTIAAAAKALRRDQADCRSQGGYSDREIVRGDGTPLDAAEQDIYAAEYLTD